MALHSAHLLLNQWVWKLKASLMPSTSHSDNLAFHVKWCVVFFNILVPNQIQDQVCCGEIGAPMHSCPYLHWRESIAARILPGKRIICLQDFPLTPSQRKWKSHFGGFVACGGSLINTFLLFILTTHTLDVSLLHLKYRAPVWIFFPQTVSLFLVMTPFNYSVTWSWMKLHLHMPE